MSTLAAWCFLLQLVPIDKYCNMKHSHKELFLISFLLSSALADPWEFLVSQKRHPKKTKIMTIPHHTFSDYVESREVFAWIQVKKPSYSNSDTSNSDEYDKDDDCLPITIAQETEEIGSVNFRASHPDLPNRMQTFAVAINQTSEVYRVLCFSHLTTDSEKAISFEAGVNKPVCRDVKVRLEMGGVECGKTPEWDIAKIQSSQSLASHQIKEDNKKCNILYYVIGVLALMIVVLALILVRCGWKRIVAMFKKPARNVEDEDSESNRPLESETIRDDVPKSMDGQQRGESRNKNKKD